MPPSQLAATLAKDACMVVTDRSAARARGPWSAIHKRYSAISTGSAGCGPGPDRWLRIVLGPQGPEIQCVSTRPSRGKNRPSRWMWSNVASVSEGLSLEGGGATRGEREDSHVEEIFPCAFIGVFLGGSFEAFESREGGGAHALQTPLSPSIGGRSVLLAAAPSPGRL